MTWSAPSPVQELDDERVRRAGVRLLLKRDDLLHPPVSGTKWRKLQPNLELAQREGHDTLLTFGGAYSNHLRAAAAAGREAGLRTVGVVRGDELRGRELNPVLAQAAADGMELEFVSRAQWRRRMEPESLDAFRRRYGRAWVVPEGGSNAEGVRGCVALGEELRDCGAELVCCSVGTGGMLAGLAAGLAPGQRALGFAALGHADLAAETRALQQDAFGGPRGDWAVDDAAAVFGGYGRRTPELDAFRADFEARHGLALDPTYETKLLWALFTRFVRLEAGAEAGAEAKAGAKAEAKAEAGTDAETAEPAVIAHGTTLVVVVAG
ncbi:1-aminocyclopropane-1-carboxylate deaminase/D-cysteine desulfhydrase [Streptacidiphilus anmyonensis]|uniref:1-aminocyclopropane-1-carboxylate deaminase/D-cysteine desulfhydrase n=1 Tax=Streptacidiphilus anmyonensis TaxID=405782 RepID=UPI0007C73F15|nr:pyridoxal-phosphate dependent enzyme [Streptacidiphilus anmyonensis]